MHSENDQIQLKVLAFSFDHYVYSIRWNPNYYCAASYSNDLNNHVDIVLSSCIYSTN